MVVHGDLVVQDVRGLVEVDALEEDRLVVEMERQAGGVVGAVPLEGAAGLDLEHVIDPVAVLIDPAANRVTRIARLYFCGPAASVREDSAKVLGAADQDVG